jgi:hypothetical protein
VGNYFYPFAETDKNYIQIVLRDIVLGGAENFARAPVEVLAGGVELAR